MADRSKWLNDDVSDVLADRRGKAERRRLAVVVFGLGGAAVVAVGILTVALVVKGRQTTGNPAPTPAVDAGNGSPIPFVPIPGGGAKPTGPVASGVAGRMDANRWTYRELFEHLDAKGLGVRFASSGGRTYFVRGGNPKYDFDINSYVKLGTWPDGVVAVDQMQDEEAARQAAGRSLKKTYHFRRWYFTGDETLLAGIRRVLED